MEGNESSISTFHCSCPKPKTRKLVFDGGSSGQYAVELCSTCYPNERKKFLISEKRIGDTCSNKGGHNTTSTGGAG